MLRSGAEHLERLRDGRVIYVGNERIDDVTSHPLFRNAARTVASIYDMKADPANRDTMSFAEGGERYSMHFLLPRTQEDLRRRMRAHKAIADMTYGLLGRSPDHVASFVSGMATDPSVFGAGGRPFAENLVAYHRFMRRNDIYASYAVVPPQAARNPEFYVKQNLPVPTLQVVREADDGIVISGMKMLATAAAFADEIWIGNLIPLAPDQVKQAVTCAVPVNAPGLTLWSRQPFTANSEFDSPLAWRFDESDCMVMCDQVKVPWERVFVMDDAVRAREIYIRTPGHCYGNHQSNVRYWSKLRLIVGLASRVASASGADQIPAVRELLGRLAALEATLAGMIHGQIEAWERWPEGYACFNRRYMYAALNWCTEMYSPLIDILRELSGGGVFQMPASVSVMHDPHLRGLFEAYWQTPQLGAVDRVKLFKLVWDLVGSEFAGRHLQYEKFYAGASFIIRNHNYREAPWDAFHAYADELLASYGVPEA
ncbi:MAG TPA: 4-hydroxyphenylacetate 3-hydroxylase N-terminal domain-containing protein [Stellaceae bacterium]|nr:4-hydroxyphenylacetate 3-hydroxylase N-terminal domain-containing protein [Stellaceae bacterium]